LAGHNVNCGLLHTARLSRNGAADDKLGLPPKSIRHCERSVAIQDHEPGSPTPGLRRYARNDDVDGGEGVAS
jgi:hypothetical protein